MKRTIYISIMIFFFGSLISCMDMDIPPKNIMTDEDIYNEGGIKAYMAGMYNHLPMDDFNASDETGSRDNVNMGGYFHWNSIKWTMLSTGETVNRNNTGMYYHDKGYWQQGYEIIRNANKLIENLPDYIGKLPDAEKWIAEARFIRAYVYFSLAKRYGGVPIVDKVQQIENGDPSSIWVARNSHRETYDFILSDLDYAIENMSNTGETGRANKFVAAALKSRVALFAGSIARYGSNHIYTVESVMLCGIPSEKANYYFEEAWNASKVVEEGKYALYKGNSDPTQNFIDVFAKAATNTESIFIREYDYTNYVHSFDAIYSPPRMTSTYGDRYNITLDWVELFDGLPINPSTGHLETTDSSNDYIVYESVGEIFENAEPRLKGSVMIPGQTYKGVELDIRSGIIQESVDPSVKIQKFIPDDGNTTTAYANVPYFKTNVQTTTQVITSQTPYETSTGVKLNKNGMDGPANGGSNNTLTGFHGLKWLDLSLTPSETKLHSSYQPWVDIRYAEVLLNRAEAALELFQNGVSTLESIDLQDDAYQCINSVRERGGATLLGSPSELSTGAAYNRHEGPGGFVQAPNKGLQLIRVERYKELAFEHKLFWDLRRWFTFDKQIYNYRRRMIAPFLFAKGAKLSETGYPEGKYIIDTRVCERSNNNLNFEVKYYYEGIPGGEIKTNPLLQQNKNY